jgi:hypothetical protein
MYYLLYAVTLATRDNVRFDEWIVMAKKDPNLKERREREREWYRKRTWILDIFVGITQAMEGTFFSMRWPDGGGGGITWLHTMR